MAGFVTGMLLALLAKDSWKLKSLDEIIDSIDSKQTIQTIAYFGLPDDIEIYLNAAPGIPKIVFTETLADIHLAKTIAINREILFIIVGEFMDRALLLQLDNAFFNMQSKSRGIFITTTTTINQKEITLEDMKDQFKWCWKNGYVNVLLLRESMELKPTNNFSIYAYTRFPELTVLQLFQQVDTIYFPNRLLNLHGYRMRSPILYDPPRVFLHKNSTTIKGYAATMFINFLKHFNAQLEIIRFKNSSNDNIFSVIDLLNGGIVDIAMNPYIPINNVRLSYPIKMMKWCVMVPYSREIEPYKYFVRPFQISLWQFCIYSLFVLALLKYIIYSLCARKQNRRYDLGRSLLQTLRLMLYMPVPTLKHNRRFLLHPAIAHLFVALFGFILSNLYLASITSLFAVIIFEEQLNSLEGIVARNLSITAIDYEIQILLNDRSLPAGFANLYKSRYAAEYTQQIIALTPFKAFAILEDLALFVLIQQSHLLHPVYHVVDECITTVPVGFLMPGHSPFEGLLNDYIVRAAAAGLTFKWLKMSIADGFKANILQIREENLSTTSPLTLNHFSFAWLILFGGYALAFGFFLLEHFGWFDIKIWFGLKNRKSNK